MDDKGATSASPSSANTSTTAAVTVATPSTTAIATPTTATMTTPSTAAVSTPTTSTKTPTMAITMPSTSSTSAFPSGTTGTKKKHEDKIRKRDPKSWENVSKSMANMSEDGKFPHLCEKYQLLYSEFRNVSNISDDMKKQFLLLQKTSDSQESELVRCTITKGHLESICRQLQKQNKQLKEENMAKIKEEEDRRKEMSSSFADRLGEINQMMVENREKSDKLREENLKMTAKLSDLYNQFQQREDEIAKMSEQLSLEREHSKATLAKMELEIKAEKEINFREQAIMKDNLEKSEANCVILLDTVRSLQEHIEIYKTQYEGFESTMSKSAKVFDNFKYEIANISKQLATVERESQSWKHKFHESMKALVEVTEAKNNQDALLQCAERKNEQLQKLCRKLQTDRAEFLKLLKVHGIEPASSSSSQDDEAKNVATVSLTAKEKELQMLKENLQVMKEELCKLHLEEAQKTETVTSPTKNEEASATDVPVATVEPSKENPIVTNNTQLVEVLKDSVINPEASSSEEK